VAVPSRCDKRLSALEKKLAGDFIANVSHELRTPLTSISGICGKRYSMRSPEIRAGKANFWRSSRKILRGCRALQKIFWCWRVSNPG